MEISKINFNLLYFLIVFVTMITGNLFAQDGNAELSKSEIKEFV